MSVGLALSASLCFGVQTLAVKYGLTKDEGVTTLAAATITLTTSTAVLWTVVGVQRGLPPLPSLGLLVPFVVAGVADPGLSRLLYPAVGAALLAASFVVVKFGFDSYPDTLVATAVTQTAAVLLVAPVAFGSQDTRRYARTATPRAVSAFLFAGVTVGIGWYAMFLALDLGRVVTVLPLVSTYPLVVVIGTYAAARERAKSPTLLAAVLAIVLGAATVQIV